MKINRVFDVIGPKGPVPNGLNWNYTNTFWEHDFYIYTVKNNENIDIHSDYITIIEGELIDLI